VFHVRRQDEEQLEAQSRMGIVDLHRSLQVDLSNKIGRDSLGQSIVLLESSAILNRQDNI